MRLLNAETKEFEDFPAQAPPYAILSHTWGSNELTYQDVKARGWIPSVKTDGCCAQALKNGLNYVWIDTCCIDKSSSAELSETINSMWNWYRQANICYAYLVDVSSGTDVYEEDSAFSRSLWFTRGWTLQELIAPLEVKFYNQSWNFIGRKCDIQDSQEFTAVLSRVTSVPIPALTGKSDIKVFSVAQKMSWAAHRRTTREEDVAYSLLGLFDLSMPLLYGEGRRAFVRLQEEILKASDDESIFAWGWRLPAGRNAALLTSSPADFAGCASIVPFVAPGLKPSHYTLTNKGLQFATGIRQLPLAGRICLARIHCSDGFGRGNGRSLALALVRSPANDMVLTRFKGTKPIWVPSSLFSNQVEQFYLHRSLGHWSELFLAGLTIHCRYNHQIAGSSIDEFYPPSWRRILDSRGPYFTNPRTSRHNTRTFFFSFAGKGGQTAPYGWTTTSDSTKTTTN